MTTRFMTTSAGVRSGATALAVLLLSAATLGALACVGRHQRRLGVLLLEVLQDGAALARDHLAGAAGLHQHWREPGRVQALQAFGPLPIALDHLLERQPLLAQGQPGLA